MFGSIESVIDPTGPDEERVGEAIEKVACSLLDRCDGGEPDEALLGASGDDACDVKRRADGAASRVDEGGERRQLLLGRIDRSLERGDVARDDPGCRLSWMRGGQFGAEVEETILYP